MNNKTYIFFIIFLAILAICGIYNFFTPIKNLNDNEKTIYEGKILQITKEYNYNENSKYIEKYVAEVIIDNNEHITVTLNNENLEKYKEKDKINYYEDRGSYYITEEEKTPTNGGVAWLVLSGVEIGMIIFLSFKKFKVN